MTRTQDLHTEYVGNMVAYLHEQNEQQLSYKLLRDYRGETNLSDEEMVAIFRTVVCAGDPGAAIALLQTGTGWVETASGEFLKSE